MVDDSPADRRLFEILLRETYGAQLTFFGEGTATEGLEACRTRSPDCVLLKYKLPDLTGIEFLKRLQAGESADFPDYAAAMLTGLSSGQVAVAALMAAALTATALKGRAPDCLPKSGMTAEALSLAIEKATPKVTLLRTPKAKRDRRACSLAEKAVPIKEAHHRVKNNLQVIASLLRLQAGAFDHEDLAHAPRKSQSRLESMALVHRQSDQSEGLRVVDISQHAALPAGLILNELISNALRHAFPGGRCGSIRIEGFLERGEILLAVSDEGAGVPERPHPSARKSIGLEIIAILTRQLKGKIELDPANETTFRLSFPKEQRIHAIFAIHRIA